MNIKALHLKALLADKTESVDDVWRCNVCQTAFVTQRDAKLHLKRIHNLANNPGAYVVKVSRWDLNFGV